jgi:hypothetical protein
VGDHKLPPRVVHAHLLAQHMVEMPHKCLLIAQLAKQGAKALCVEACIRRPESCLDHVMPT